MKLMKLMADGSHFLELGACLEDEQTVEPPDDERITGKNGIQLNVVCYAKSGVKWVSPGNPKPSISPPPTYLVRIASGDSIN